MGVNWSKSAIECYSRGCRCRGCINETICKSQPLNRNDYKLLPMKYTVIKAYEAFGNPFKDDLVYRRTTELEDVMEEMQNENLNFSS